MLEFWNVMHLTQLSWIHLRWFFDAERLVTHRFIMSEASFLWSLSLVIFFIVKSSQKWPFCVFLHLVHHWPLSLLLNDTDTLTRWRLLVEFHEHLWLTGGEMLRWGEYRYRIDIEWCRYIKWWSLFFFLHKKQFTLLPRTLNHHSKFNTSDPS